MIKKNFLRKIRQSVFVLLADFLSLNIYIYVLTWWKYHPVVIVIVTVTIVVGVLVVVALVIDVTLSSWLLWYWGNGKINNVIGSRSQPSCVVWMHFCDPTFSQLWRVPWFRLWTTLSQWTQIPVTRPMAHIHVWTGISGRVWVVPASCVKQRQLGRFP